MGWSGYLVDKKNKILFECFKTTEEDFLEAVNDTLEALRSNYNIHEKDYISVYDIQTKAVQKLTVKDMNIISRCLDISFRLNRSLDVLLAALYYIFVTKSLFKNEEVLGLDSRFDFYTDGDKEKYKKYISYELISQSEEEEV